MRNIKRRIETFTFYDYTNIEKHLEKMASKGWMLEKCSQYTWKYRRIEPKKIHFNVTYFPKASQYDPEPSEKQKIFIDFCEEAGWKPIASNAQMQIFANEAENPVPIETDAAVQVENIHEAMKKNYLWAMLILLFVMLANMFSVVDTFFTDPIRGFGDNVNLCFAICFSMVSLALMLELTSYFLWYRRAKRAAELDGSFIHTKDHRKLQMTFLLIGVFALLGVLDSLGNGKKLLVILAYLVWIYAIVGLVNLVKYILKKNKVETNTSRVVTVGAVFIIIITMSICGAIGWTNLVDSEWFNEEESETVEQAKYDNIFLSQVDVDESCSIITIKVPAIYDFCLTGMIRKNTTGIWSEMGWTYAKDDEKLWGAEAVYKLYNREDFGESLRTYLVCWDNRIVEFTFYREPTEQLIQKSIEKLK